LKGARPLREAGLDEQQAETIADLLRESRELDLVLLATKNDLADLRNATAAEFAELRNETKAELAALRHDMDLRFTALQAEIDRRFATVDGKFATVRTEIASLEWMVGGIGFGLLLLVIRSFWPGLG
jgi:ribosomal protein L29